MLKEITICPILLLPKIQKNEIQCYKLHFFKCPNQDTFFILHIQTFKHLQLNV